ncbi:MAG TPA: CCA tRNA nucleotidyltransferase [Acidobacteriaceae bacterium]|nr:CCA tRNA nucleotidyltransferase [Acidobacteriaceae bacterium]
MAHVRQNGARRQVSNGSCVTIRLETGTPPANPAPEESIPAPSPQLAAEHIVVRLRAAGYEAYFAGGCVRDMLLGLEPKDFDVATSAHPDVVLAMFPRTFAVGAQFGVILVCQDVDNAAGPGRAREIVTEVATFRSDVAYQDGRHPTEVRFSATPQEDVIRRDFTINGMMFDPVLERQTCSLTSAVLDYVGGRADLRDGIIRAIGEPHRRFEEDKLRMLRAVRFAARFEYTIEPETEGAIRQLAAGIAQVSRERVRDEITKMLTEGRARRAFELLDATGLLRAVLPEVTRLQNVAQPPEYHPEGDVWIHTLLVLEKLPAGVSPTLAWGALLHDIGKPATFSHNPPDRIRFNGHVEVGVRIAHEILRRLRFSNEDCDQILALVENHMRFGDVGKMKISTLKRFFRLPKFDEHLALHRLDVTSSHGDLSLYEFAKRKREELPEEEVRPQLLVTGRDLIDAGYQPGPRFKEMLQLAEDAQLEGRIQTREDGLALIRREILPPTETPKNETGKRNPSI